MFYSAFIRLFVLLATHVWQVRLHEFCEGYENSTLCENFYTCDQCPQFCYPRNEDAVKCYCANGYRKLYHNSDQCVPNDEQNFILISHKNGISKYNMISQEVHSVYEEEHTSPHKIDYLFEKEMIFWTDLNDGILWKANIRNANKDNKQKVLQFHNGLVDNEKQSIDFVVDWIHKHIYYTNASGKSVMVTDLDGKFSKVIYEVSNRNYDVRIISLVIDPIHSLLYGLSYGTHEDSSIHYVFKMTLDGMYVNRMNTYRNTIAFGLTIDLVTHKLMWTFIKNYMFKRSEYLAVKNYNDGVLIRRAKKTRDYETSSTINTGGNIYWSKAGTGEIYTSKINKLINTLVYTHPHIINSITIYHKFVQHKNNTPDPCEHHNCEQLCLTTMIRKDPPVSIGLCVCRDGMRLSTDNRTCIAEDSKKDEFISYRKYPQACPFRSGDFMCDVRNPESCYDPTYFCDRRHHVHCNVSRRDEDPKICNELHSINECLSNNGKGPCSDVCVDLKYSFVCDCFPGRKLINGTHCEERPPYEVCTQGWTSNNGTIQCHCTPGYYNDPSDTSFCLANAGHGHWIFTHDTGFKEVDLNDNLQYSDTIMADDNDEGVSIMERFDYDHNRGEIFWVAESDKLLPGHDIWRSPIGKGNRKTLFRKVPSAINVVVDWIYDRVYWVEEHEHDEHRIVVSNIDLEDRETENEPKFITLYGTPEEITAIVVDPNRGLMFWSESLNNVGRIFAAGLDCSNRKLIADNFRYVSDMTLDLVMGRIFWIDRKNGYIESCSYDGTNRTLVYYEYDPYRPSFSDYYNFLEFFEGKIYVIKDDNYLYKIQLNGVLLEKMYMEVEQYTVYFGRIYHQLRQPKGSNYCLNHRCQYMCFAIQSSSNSGRVQTSCQCPDGETPAEDGVSCTFLNRQNLSTSTKEISPEINTNSPEFLGTENDHGSPSTYTTFFKFVSVVIFLGILVFIAYRMGYIQFLYDKAVNFYYIRRYS